MKKLVKNIIKEMLIFGVATIIIIALVNIQSKRIEAIENGELVQVSESNMQ